MPSQLRLAFEPCEDVAGGLVDVSAPQDALRGDVGIVGERPRLGGELEAAVRRADVVFRPHENAARLACGLAVQARSASTTRGPAPNASDPDTRSTGSAPSLRLVR